MVKSLEASVYVGAEYPLAPEYERVHFVGTALFNIGITEKLLDEHADEMIDRLQEKVGYRVFLVDIKIKNRILWTDVDFVMDIPYGWEGSPAVTLAAAIAFILAHWKAILLVIVALAFIVWLFWTTWIEKSKIYYCEQHPEPLAFQGYVAYLAHLAAFHPEKYEAASEKPWWEKLIELGKYIPWVVGGLVTLSFLKLISRRRD